MRTGEGTAVLQPQARNGDSPGPRRREAASPSALSPRSSGPCRRLEPSTRRESDVPPSEAPRWWRPFAVTAQDSVKQAGQLPAASYEVTWRGGGHLPGRWVFCCISVFSTEPSGRTMDLTPVTADFTPVLCRGPQHSGTCDASFTPRYLRKDR